MLLVLKWEMIDLIKICLNCIIVQNTVVKKLVERPARMQKIGCTNPRRDRQKFKTQDHCQTLDNRRECQGSSEMTIKRMSHVSVYV